MATVVRAARYKVGMVVVARCTCQPPDDSDGHQPRYVIEAVPPCCLYHARYGFLLRNVATGRRHRTSVRTLDREYLLAEVRDL